MMKRINITFEVDNEGKAIRDHIKKAFSLIVDGGLEFVFVDLICRNVESKHIYPFLKWFKEYTEQCANEHNVLLRCSVELNAPHIDKRLARLLARWVMTVRVDDNTTTELSNALAILQKQKVDYCVQIADLHFPTVWDKYISYKRAALPISVPIHYRDFGKAVVEHFKDWAYDPDGTDLSIYSNVVSHILLNYQGESCVHSSCLGKTLVVYSDGSTSFCRFHKSIACLKDIITATDISAVFSSEPFVGAIKTGIEKRAECSVGCKDFKICQGGCPLEGNSCSDTDYLLFYREVARSLKEIVYIENYARLNPYLRLKILSAIAMGNAFDSLEAALNENT